MATTPPLGTKPNKTKPTFGANTQPFGGLDNTNSKPFSNNKSNVVDESKYPKSPSFVPSPFTYSELAYLFAPNAKFDNQENTNTIDNLIPKSLQDNKYTVIYKDTAVNNTNTIKEHINTWVNNWENANPYEGLIKTFKDVKSMRLKPSDFAYLTNLGVYPMNRLWILRRYKETDTVPTNLNDWLNDGPSPIATLVGWMKPEGEGDLMNVTFGETWTTTTKMLHTQLLEIMDKEFGLKLGGSVPVPGFSRGLLFQFLKKMGITNDDWGTTAIPVGDPDVLGMGATRMQSPDDTFGLKSDFKITLETSYEMKFIGDIDPGSAMLDIINNVIYMGTSNTKFIMKAEGSTVWQNLNWAINHSNDPNAWLDFITTLVGAFLDACKELFDEALKTLGNITKDNTKKKNEPVSNGDGTWTWSDGHITDNQGKTIKPKKDSNSGKPDESKTSIQEIEKKAENVVGNITNIIGQSDLLKSLLTSTVAIYRWPLKGSIALMTGQASTPWHLTVGNPYSPFISLSNIVIDNISIGFSNEFNYNDMPSRINVTISIKLGRPLGAQEIFAAFNNSYQRIYSVQTQKYLLRKTGMQTMDLK